MEWMKRYRVGLMQTHHYFGDLAAFGFATNSAESVWRLYK